MGLLYPRAGSLAAVARKSSEHRVVYVNHRRVVVADGTCHDALIMKDGRRRFIRLTWFGLTSTSLAMFVACESDPSSPFEMAGPDAASIDLGDARTNPSSRPDAADAATDTSPEQDAADSSSEEDAAPDASTEAGEDASVAVNADVAKDFSTLANPNGAWTYGYALGDPTGTDAGAIVVYSAVASAGSDTASWYDPANSVLGAPNAWRNDGATVVNGLAPGEFAIHPGNAGEYAIVRWTAPAAGVYAVTLQFKTGDSGDTNGLLLHNGVALVTEDSTSSETIHDLDVTLAAGDYLDVAVGNKGDFLFDTTPVHLTIRSSAP
jgi:hypothetical protein